MSAGTIEWVKSRAVPPGVTIIVSSGVVVWLGPSRDMPEYLPWPDPVTVNCNEVDFETIAKAVKAREKGKLVHAAPTQQS
jgi:hypothetical protein